MPGDWFEALTGFREDGYDATRERLTVEGDELVSLVNAARYGIGKLTVPTLWELRQSAVVDRGRTTVSNVVGDARALHSSPEFEGATFQVASQFNLLEMTAPGVTPEAGVTRYQDDPTQGPACAMAAGAATIYRNYFAEVDGQPGQTHDRQLNALTKIGTALADAIGVPVSALWTMRNGYALCTEDGLHAIADRLRACSEPETDDLRAQLAIGLHSDVQVTDVVDGPRRLVTQAFCSALPVAYGVQSPDWEPFARLVLEASYEATLRAATAGSSNVVLLTRVGGGVFGNDDEWIDDAIERALHIVEFADLDVRLVSRGSVHPSFKRIESEW